MPTQTFFNLQNDKQKKIIDASKREFGKNNFYDASINRIVKDAGIARGSFYQYFENKEDLFIYLLDKNRNLMLEDISKNFEGKKHDIFEFLLIIYDFIIEEGLASEDKDFIINTISNMDVKLTKHLFGFLKCEDLEKDLSRFSYLVHMDNLKIKNPMDIGNLHNILLTIMMNQLVLVFNDIENKKEYKQDLINKLNLIKYGVIKDK